MPIAAGPRNSEASCHSAPEGHDILRARLMSAPRPSVAQDNVSDPTRPASPRRCGEYGLCTHGLGSLAPRGVVVCLVQAQALRPLFGGRWSFHHDGVKGRLQQLGVMDVGTSNHYTQRSTLLPLGGYAWYRLCHGQWGWGRLAPPKTSLAHGSICRLPFPLYTSQVVTLLHQYRPYLDKYTHPTLESAVDGAVTTQFLGQMVPLAAAADRMFAVRYQPWTPHSF